MSSPSSPSSSTCPFCGIAKAYPPISPTAFITHNQTEQTNPPTESPSTTNPSLIASPGPSDPATHLILSTKHVLAFLDIMPLTRGHVLVIPRTHYEKLGDVDVRVSRELGQWLPIISRVVMRIVLGEDNSSDWDWNVVQNNGISTLSPKWLLLR
ncbi:hypothetical protein BDV23DRAFT_992 [Aspergillus alliaceus]|uniref:Uncharacterized protein n=1 Tax=Petromyces alliaceus TaxID=209559 RepID=A0A5N6FQI6_PETAA|nr:uncharacterized protein BDW43DRAFT_112155 [Aspergillus alliaceus]KAB8232271.1 hypothetical protein BDW43DRAFT_112155 [Aspergillus alliaceus]KAE8396524.1 hypothetical protein BDV23DRAFT_992 [Aspergillus alliaceus]